MEPQDLNNNCDYNQDYKVVLSFHLIKKNRDLDPDKINETIFRGKCVTNTRNPKICKKLYFGKENETYFVIFIIKRTHIDVITTWKRKGN